MKKILIVLGVLAMVAGMSVTAFSAGLEEPNNCVGCDRKNQAYPVGRVPMPDVIPGTDQLSGYCNVEPFDFDGSPLNYPDYYATHGQYGYCETGNGTIGSYNTDDVGRANRNMKLLFQVCGCTEALRSGWFAAGNTIGIRMSILADNVYFTRPNDPATNDTDGRCRTNVRVRTFYNETEACAAMSYGQDDFSPADATNNFGAASYFTAASCRPDQRVNPCALTAPEWSDCSAYAVNHPWSKAIQTPVDTGFVIPAGSVTDQNSVWWIDVPPMILHKSAKAGDPIDIKVEMLDPRGTICSSCPALCACVYRIAYIGCEVPTVQIQSIMRFPYVVQQSSSGFGCGIVITNLQPDTVTNPVVSMSLIDQNGRVSKVTNVPLTGKGMAVWGLDALITGDNALNWNPAPTPGMEAWLCITGNFYMDGYSFVTNGFFGAGTLPRIDQAGTWTGGTERLITCP